jgi:hypothetical protein
MYLYIHIYLISSSVTSSTRIRSFREPNAQSDQGRSDIPWKAMKCPHAVSPWRMGQNMYNYAHSIRLDELDRLALFSALWLSRRPREIRNCQLLNSTLSISSMKVTKQIQPTASCPARRDKLVADVCDSWCFNLIKGYEKVSLPVYIIDKCDETDTTNRIGSRSMEIHL